ncbi:MAG: hypothetical protein VYD19_00415 [Myxococcota bacterium]|nr:hypothetical protein [Myxococcota bacterium]
MTQQLHWQLIATFFRQRLRFGPLSLQATQRFSLALFRARAYEELVALLSESTLRWPKDLFLLECYAQAALYAQLPALSLSIRAELARLQPDQPTAKLQWLYLADQLALESVTDELNRYIKRFPLVADAYALLAARASAVSDHEGVLYALSRQEELSGTLPLDARLQRARALFALGEALDARDELRWLVRRRRRWVEAWSLLATIELHLEEEDYAELAARRALRVDPLDGRANYLLGLICEERSIQQASLHYYRSLDANRPVYVSYLGLARLHQRLREWEAALKAYQRYLPHARPSEEEELRAEIDRLRERLNLDRKKHEEEALTLLPDSAVIDQERLLTESHEATHD